MFDYDGSFQSAIAALKRERRYRVFADLERKAGQFPHALRAANPKAAQLDCFIDFGRHSDTRGAASRSVTMTSYSESGARMSQEVLGSLSL